jgi:hypothetical protein
LEFFQCFEEVLLIEEMDNKKNKNFLKKKEYLEEKLIEEMNKNESKHFLKK